MDRFNRFNRFHHGKSIEELRKRAQQGEQIPRKLCEGIALLLDDKNPKILAMCSYWLKVCYSLRKMGFVGQDWKISLCGCRYQSCPVKTEQDLLTLDLGENWGVKKPTGIWFSNFYEPIMVKQGYGV